MMSRRRQRRRTHPQAPGSSHQDSRSRTAAESGGSFGRVPKRLTDGAAHTPPRWRRDDGSLQLPPEMHDDRRGELTAVLCDIYASIEVEAAREREAHASGHMRLCAILAARGLESLIEQPLVGRRRGAKRLEPNVMVGVVPGPDPQAHGRAALPAQRVLQAPVQLRSVVDEEACPIAHGASLLEDE